MSEIKVERLSQEKLDELKVNEWSKWECEPSKFDWEYAEDEACYILEGKAKVETSTGDAEFEKGDLVKFPKGLKCKWNVIEKIRKVYKLG